MMQPMVEFYSLHLAWDVILAEADEVACVVYAVVRVVGVVAS